MPLGNRYVTYISMAIIIEYETKSGKSPFGKWLGKLDTTLRIVVIDAINRLEFDAETHVKFLGQDLWETKLTIGGGLRLYWTKDGEQIILLLGGGKKDTQAKDIQNARLRRIDYLKGKDTE